MKRRALKDPVSKFTVVVLAGLVICLNFIFQTDRVIVWDFFGYYLYLPLSFIYHDLFPGEIGLISELFGQYEPATTLYHVFKTPEGGWVIKYSLGIALLNMPFFFSGHLFALLSGFPADGFSLPYQKAAWLGAIVYTLAGLFVLRRVLLNFFNDRVSSIVLLVLFLGTNYLNYTSLFALNTISQNYLFTLYVCIIWYTIRWHRNRKIIEMVMLSLVCGLSILSRPTELICLLIPLLWGVHNRESLSDKVRLLSSHSRQVMVFIAVVALLGSLQLIYWKLATGQFFFNGYSNNPGEGLDLHNPHILKVLFSFRKGWLIYTPVMVFSLIGLAGIFREQRSIFYAVLVYLVLNIYLVSSWTNWWYAHSFGQRALIPSYAVLALPLGFFLSRLLRASVFRRVGVYVLLGSFILLNLFQTWQYSAGILNGSRMTAKYYLKIFGKTSVNEKDRKLLLVSRSEWPVEKVPDESDYISKRIFFDSYADTSSFLRMDGNRRFTPAFRVAFGELTKKDHFYVRASAEVFIPGGSDTEPPLMVMSFEHKGKLYKYNTKTLESGEINPGEWNTLTMDYLSPHPRSGKDELSVYLWYRGDRRVYIRNLEIVHFDPE